MPRMISLHGTAALTWLLISSRSAPCLVLCILRPGLGAIMACCCLPLQ
jgi:hypothetical protein